MTQREEEADPHRLTPLLEKLPGGVVDGCDVVRVERVPQPECIGEAAQSQKTRMLGAVRQEQPPSDHVQHAHRSEKAAQAGTLTRIKGSPDKGPECRHVRSLIVTATESQLCIQLGPPTHANDSQVPCRAAPR